MSELQFVLEMGPEGPQYPYPCAFRTTYQWRCQQEYDWYVAEVARRRIVWTSDLKMMNAAASASDYALHASLAAALAALRAEESVTDLVKRRDAETRPVFIIEPVPAV